MTNQSILITTFFSLVFSSFVFQLEAQIADKVFKNAKVYTTNNTFEEAIAVKDGNLIYVGTDVGVNDHIGGGTVVEDLGGKLMLPGIHDVHMHPLEAGSSIGGDCLLDNMETDPTALATAIGNCNLTPNSNGWLTASGHSIFALFDPTPIPLDYSYEILDNIYPSGHANFGKPMVVMEETSHSVWVNSAALTALGITSSTSDPVGGHIVKDATNGNIPTGVLLDNAGDLALKAAFASNATTDAQNKDGLVNYSLPLLAESGITSICEGRTYWKRNYHTIWQSIKDDGDLTCRVILSPWAYPEDTDASLITALTALYNTGDDMLKTTHVKLYADGIVINATAALHDPYDYYWDLPFDSGLNYITEARMTTLITALEAVGFDFHIHALGDRGITEALNAIDAARTNNPLLTPRHRITHLEIVKTSDFTRFQPLDVTADMQVAGNFTNPANWGENEFLVGSSRTDNIIPLRSFHDADARITLSSDWDVSSVNPFVGMQNALTRSPQQLPNVEEVVKAYTINAAYVMRQENNTGTLEVGKWADFIVTDKDIFTIPTNQINTTKTLLTYVGGTEVYRSASLPLPVEMLYFEIKKADCSITLEWATATELNNDKFVIERSSNGTYFESIGEVSGQGTRLESMVYTFIDTEPNRVNYYRLRQIDFDGTEDLSPVVSARKDCEVELDVQISPNITSYLSMIQLAGGQDDELEIQLLSAQGKVIKQFSMEHRDEISQSPLNVTFLPEGVYYLRILSEKNQYSETKPFVVSR
ncbi:MAG: amidohydrolase family protein [Bacteroidetes bacterium]|nr:amidohydrolase family protein [Bacteroidota bacterium]